MSKILVIDDHQLFRAGIIKIFGNLPGYEIVAEAETGEEALQLVREKTPDMVLMDIAIGGIGGLETIRRIKRIQQGIKVLVVTDYENAPYPTRALKAGADGYFSKKDCSQNLIQAVKTIMSGQHYITARVAQELVLRNQVEYVNPFEALSARELQVTSFVTQGYKVSDIAEEMYLSPKTINTYRYRIYGKLGVNSDVGLAIMAMQYGVIADQRRKRRRV